MTEAGAVAGAHHVDDLVAHATSAVRDATNQEAVLAEIEAATAIHVGFMSGLEEARLTFLAARGWYGWSADRMLLFDIGGGSMEIASGGRAEPDAAISVPLGAGRLTRHHLPETTPVKKREVKELRAYVRSVISEATAELRELPAPASCVATSKTFGRLARLTGGPKPKPGTCPSSTLGVDRLRPWIPRLVSRTDAQRAKLRGVSASRAHQSLAGQDGPRGRVRRRVTSPSMRGGPR
ncbi:Ppx/GppA phosphatase family protein [Streptomyces sp. NPDC007983]|uniref:Ppx/GppA phosphatase family protein n=1 Tax=Streptomyces sp. NPDC007983 TaxID=3364800 RepID=UPI0036E8A1F3